MAWIWKDEEEGGDSSSSAGGGDPNTNPNPNPNPRYSTRRVVKSQCRTEEVEPGKFVRKCEKTEEILKDCVGRPAEVVQSNKEYTEDDVTNEVVRGTFSVGSADVGAFGFPGLRNDLEAMERNFANGLGRFFEAAEDMGHGFFNVFGSPRVSEGGQHSGSSSLRRGIPIDGGHHSGRGATIEFEPPHDIDINSGDVDLSGLARDV